VKVLVAGKWEGDAEAWRECTGEGEGWRLAVNGSRVRIGISRGRELGGAMPVGGSRRSGTERRGAITWGRSNEWKKDMNSWRICWRGWEREAGV